MHNSLREIRLAIIATAVMSSATILATVGPIDGASTDVQTVPAPVEVRTPLSI